PFALLNRFTTGTTLRLAGLVNVLLGAGLLWLDRRASVSVPEAVPPDATPREAGRAGLAGLLGLAALSGALSLAFEIIVVRSAFTLNPSSPYNFPVVLAAYLVALAIGSFSATHGPMDEPSRILTRVGLLFSASAVAVVLSTGASALLTLALVHPVL